MPVRESSDSEWRIATDFVSFIEQDTNNHSLTLLEYAI